MITAISSVEQNGNVGNNANFKRANQIAFTGSPISLLKSEGKISRFADEATSSIGKIFKTLLGKAELPFSKKPLTANATLTHFGPNGEITDIPVPEMHTAVTQILDASNILKPDAADLAASALDAASTKAALAGALSDAASTVDAVASGADVAGAVADGVSAVDAATAAVEHKSVLADLAHGVASILDKIF